MLLFGEGVDLAYEDHSLGCRSDAMRTLSGTQLQHVQRLPALSGRYGVRCTQSGGTQFFYHYPLFGEFDLCHTSKGISGVELSRKISICQFTHESRVYSTSSLPGSCPQRFVPTRFGVYSFSFFPRRPTVQMEDLFTPGVKPWRVSYDKSTHNKNWMTPELSLSLFVKTGVVIFGRSVYMLCRCIP
ncbi:hypothetical protein ARMGADRAFT_317622 [Armillaria gallica]|uniref:Uncharacterized protein n=1 Tax=Armillaria gallica TaxID=47427 RepID=A0A2H3DEG0_ARMGA|nr:hypothetical protein ARMGADRAFT_317622 [Armillaria gallica]